MSNFKAKYPGVCAAECGERIHVGDVVEYVGTALVHSLCANDEIPVKPETKFQGTTLEEMGY